MILPVIATADPLNPTRRLGVMAIPPLTMLRATSGDLSVAPCIASSKLKDRPFSLNFAPNPAPMPVPTYQPRPLPSDLSGGPSAPTAAGANPAIAQDKPPIPAMRQEKFMVSPRVAPPFGGNPARPGRTAPQPPPPRPRLLRRGPRVSPRPGRPPEN